MFDVHLESDLRPDRDLANLAFFGVTDALVLLHDAATPPERGRGAEARAAHPALRRLERLVEREPARLRAAGIRAHLAPGIPPGYAAVPGAAEALARLPDLLDAPGVAAVGGVGLEHATPLEERLLHAQLELAAQRRLPVVACLPRLGRPAALRHVAAAAARHGLGPSRVLFAHVNLAALREARRLGARGALAVHPSDLLPRQAAALVARHGAEALCLGSMLGAGPGDVLALVRIGQELQRAGVTEEQAARALWGNALTFLGLGGTPV